MPTGLKLQKKNAYLAKLQQLVENTPLTLIINVDNVGSKQLQHVRGALRGSCIILMGKNTMIRKSLRQRIDVLTEEGLDTTLNPKSIEFKNQINGNADKISCWTNLLQNVNGNMGFIFCQTEDSLEKARGAIDEYVVPAMAKAGTVAQCDVFLPAGPTVMEPSQTSFFQTLNIATKIVKGHIEILSETKVCIAGEKVSLSAQALLTKMNRKPFEYGIQIVSVYQGGSVFPAAVLDIDDSTLITKFLTGVSHVAAFGRCIGVPTEAGLPHMVRKAFKNVVALCSKLEGVSGGAKADEIVSVLSDPEAMAKMAAAASASAATGSGAATGGAAAAAAPVVEEEEEEEMDFDLFG